MLIVPVVPELRVRAVPAAVAIVNAPLSAILFAENVCVEPLMIAPLIVLVAVAPDIAPERPMVVAPDIAPAPEMSKDAVSKMNEAGAVPSMTIAEVKVPAVLEMCNALDSVPVAALLLIKIALVVVSGFFKFSIYASVS